MNLPNPFFIDDKKIKAFILGCDPTAFNKIERSKPVGQRKHIEFDSVFNLNGKDDRYFSGILANLEAIALNKDEIYVQNLITTYQNEESSKNKNWLRIAQDYIVPRIKEFDGIDPSRKIPVLLTSELLYKALLNKGEKRIPAKEFYNLTAEIPFPASSNKLHRPLIPFCRHPAYSLKKHKDYIEKIRNIIVQ